eukprot:58208_1
MEFVSPNFSLDLKPYKTKTGDIMWVDDPSALPIKGAIYIPNFITSEEEQKLVNIFDSHPYQQVIRRRQQFYGPVYYHTTHNLKTIQPTNDKQNTHSLNFNELQWLINKFFDKKHNKGYNIFNSDYSNYPDQCLVNEYIGNMGISTHFDDFNAFGDVITSLSLINPVYMTLQCPNEINNHCTDLKQNGKIRILLEPRSLFVMQDECRYKWRHGITKHKLVFLPQNKGVLKRDLSFRRLSATIRKLGNGRKRINKSDIGWVNPHLRREIPINNKHIDEEKNDIANTNNSENDNNECFSWPKTDEFYHKNNLKWPMI